MKKQIQDIGQTTDINGKWKAIKPKESNGWWYVVNSDGNDVCTTYKWCDGTIAKMIAKDHNEQLKVKKHWQKYYLNN